MVLRIVVLGLFGIGYWKENGEEEMMVCTSCLLEQYEYICLLLFLWGGLGFGFGSGSSIKGTALLGTGTFLRGVSFVFG